MITDEQIKQALELAGVEFQYFTHARTNKQVCTTAGSIDFNKIVSGIRELIALAQQIKPLEFVDATVGGWVRSKCYRTKSSIGTYDVYDIEGPNGRYCFYSFDYESSDNYQTLEEAIEAANADYQRRVLSCLVWGVGNETRRNKRTA